MPSPDWAGFVPETDVQGSDTIVKKRWKAAFYGTELDPHLRRRKIEAIVLCGIATTYGVESNVWSHYERGYN